MEITKEFLRKQNACAGGYEWYLKCGETDHDTVIRKLMAEDHHNWANWVIVRLMTRDRVVQYAIFAAELTLANFEKVFPNDDRPRKAIEAAREYLKNQTEKNESAESAARSARSAAESAESAAWSAESAAWSAESAESAESAARSARSAESAARSARSAALKTIIEHGLELLASGSESDIEGPGKNRSESVPE